MLTVPPADASGLWYAWPKDIPVKHGIGLSEKEAIDDVRKNVAEAIRKCVAASENVGWIEISCLRTHGSNVRYIRVDAPPPPKGKPK